MNHLILRAETKTGERRTALTPEAVAILGAKGVKVAVERSSNRVFADEAYAANGATLVRAGSWREAKDDTLVLGLKELPSSDSVSPLSQAHCYFAHCFRGQSEATSLLSRLRAGGGLLYDLEYLTDESGSRVAAFGYWAGFVGAAVALMTWASEKVAALEPAESASDLEARVRMALQGRRPSVGVTGYRGRAGSGALAFLDRLGLSARRWDLAETPSSGPLLEALDVDLLVHCAGPTRPRDSFLNAADLGAAGRRLRVLCDVTCDQEGPLHLFPFYREGTTLDRPVRRWYPEASSEFLDIVAIDHLPTLLPHESSEEFSAALLPHLLDFFRVKGLREELPIPFSRSFTRFNEALRAMENR